MLLSFLWGKKGGTGTYLSIYWILVGIVFFPLFAASNGKKEIEDRRVVADRITWTFGFLFRGIGILTFPVWEDDWARFLWDGYMTLETGSPYGKPPLFFFGESGLPVWAPEILSRINHPDVPTIYGPVLEFLFGVSAFLFPGSVYGLKLSYLGIELAAAKLIQKKISALEFRVLLWSPLVVIETYYQAHPDCIGAMFVFAAYLFLKREGSGIAGILLGLACGIKVFAWILLPFCLKEKGRLRFLLGFLPALSLPYGFFWFEGIAGGDGLRVFLIHWEFNSSVYALVRVFLKTFGADGAHTVGSVCFGMWAIVSCFFLRGYRRGDESGIAHVWLGFFLISPVVNPWYLLWAFPFWIRFRYLPGLIFVGTVSLSYLMGRTLGGTGTSLQLYETPMWVRIIEYGFVLLGFIPNIFDRESNIFCKNSNISN